jgi:hypothetical protein
MGDRSGRFPVLELGIGLVGRIGVREAEVQIALRRPIELVRGDQVAELTRRRCR